MCVCVCECVRAWVCVTCYLFSSLAKDLLSADEPCMILWLNVVQSMYRRHFIPLLLNVGVWLKWYASPVQIQRGFSNRQYSVNVLTAWKYQTYAYNATFVDELSRIGRYTFTIQSQN